MWKLTSILALLFVTASGRYYPSRSSIKLKDDHDDPTPVMVTKAGYPSETHVVTTDDGYILEMHRIPYCPDSICPGSDPEKKDRPVVFLQHGLMCSSADWVLEGTDLALGFVLSRAGYDVWMGNYRGNTYSTNHVSLDPAEYEFWKFSWDQMGQYDLPSMLGYVLNHTQASKIQYVGHSMGTTAFMAMSDYHQEIYDKIALAHLLAPVAYVGHMVSPIGWIAPFEPEVRYACDTVGFGNFLPSNQIVDAVASKICKNGDFLQEVCSSVLFLLCGFDQAQLNKTMLDTIVHHTPAGASTYTILHYAQEVNSAKFSHFDYGESENMKIYGQKSAPNYDLAKVTAPIALYFGDNDWLADREDVIKAISELPNIVKNFEVPYENFNHMDFLYAMNVGEVLYPTLLEEMAKAANSTGYHF